MYMKRYIAVETFYREKTNLYEHTSYRYKIVLFT
jgi:hypothetical protein